MKSKILAFLSDGRRATVAQIRGVSLVSGTRGTVSKCVTRLVRGGDLEWAKTGRLLYYFIPTAKLANSVPAASAASAANP